MILDYFKKYPTIEEVRQIVFDTLATVGTDIIPKKVMLDLKFECDGSIGFEYYQFWISHLYNLKYKASIRDIRDKNQKVILECFGLPS